MGPSWASVRVAETKAWTAAIFQRASVDYAAATAPGGPAYGMLNAYPGKVVPCLAGSQYLSKEPVSAGWA